MYYFVWVEVKKLQVQPIKKFMKIIVRIDLKVNIVANSFSWL